MFFKQRYRIPEHEFPRYETFAAGWSRRATTAAPIDVDAAAAVIARMYARVGLAAPRVLVTRGPIEALDTARGLMAAGQQSMNANLFNAVTSRARPHDPTFENFFTSVPVLERARGFVEAARRVAREARAGGAKPQFSGLGLVGFRFTAYYDYCLQRPGATGLDADQRLCVGQISALLRANVWDCCLLSETALLIPVPRYQGVDEENRLHRLDGPTISWPDGTAGHHVHGVSVPRHVIEEPSRITAREAQDQPNVEVRRIMIERMGRGRFLSEIGATVIDRDTDGRGMPRLLVHYSPDRWSEPEAYVEVTCPSTGHVYHLRVPPDIRKCAEAVAWTFGMSVEQYAPLLET